MTFRTQIAETQAEIKDAQDARAELKAQYDSSTNAHVKSGLLIAIEKFTEDISKLIIKLDRLEDKLDAERARAEATAKRLADQRQRFEDLAKEIRAELEHDCIVEVSNYSIKIHHVSYPGQIISILPYCDRKLELSAPYQIKQPSRHISLSKTIIKRVNEWLGYIVKHAARKDEQAARDLLLLEQTQAQISPDAKFEKVWNSVRSYSERRVKIKGLGNIVSIDDTFELDVTCKLKLTPEQIKQLIAWNTENRA